MEEKQQDSPYTYVFGNEEVKALKTRMCEVPNGTTINFSMLENGHLVLHTCNSGDVEQYMILKKETCMCIAALLQVDNNEIAEYDLKSLSNFQESKFYNVIESND